MIWSSRERNRSCSLVSRRSRGRIANPPLHQLEREESRLAIRGNPQNRICKEVALQRPKTGKFDYLSAPNHPAHSMAFKFFTDDEKARLVSRALLMEEKMPDSDFVWWSSDGQRHEAPITYFQVPDHVRLERVEM